MSRSRCRRAFGARFVAFWLAANGAGVDLLAATSSPILSLSGNDNAEVTLYRGWPLLVRAQVLHAGLMEPGASVETLEISAAEPPWSNAIRLEVRDAGGDIQRWIFHRANEPRASLRLDAQTGGEVVWWVFPMETALIPVGWYEVVGVLDTTCSPRGWKGVRRSPPVSVRLLDEPTRLLPETEAEKFLRFADFRLWQGREKRAERLVDELLKRQPDHVGALSFKGDLRAMAGEFEEALEVLETAIALVFSEDPDPPEPPRRLLRKRHELRNRLLGLRFGICGDDDVDPGEQCDDGPMNGTADSCCSSSCTFVVPGTRCEDGNSCTGTDTCDAYGVCGPGPAILSCELENVEAAVNCLASKLPPEHRLQ